MSEDFKFFERNSKIYLFPSFVFLHDFYLFSIFRQTTYYSSTQFMKPGKKSIASEQHRASVSQLFPQLDCIYLITVPESSKFLNYSFTSPRNIFFPHRKKSSSRWIKTLQSVVFRQSFSFRNFWTLRQWETRGGGVHPIGR